MRRVAIVAVMWASGCMAPGDRAASCPPFRDCTTTCPAGETCSDRTPQGLHFGGATTGDAFLPSGAPMVTARGGTQTIRIAGLGGLPFEVDVDGDGFTAIAIGADTVRITGVAAGGAVLRIVEPGTGLLYDRIGLDVADASAATVRTALLWPDGADDHALWAAADQRAVAALHGGGVRLADETMTLALPAGATASAAWDTFDAHAPIAPGTLTVGVTLTDGTPLVASAAVVDHLDALAWVPSITTAAPWDGLAVGEGGIYAFRASAGGVAVAGVPLAASVDGPLQLDPPLGNLEQVQATQVGLGHLTVTAGGVTSRYDLPVRASAIGAAIARAPAAAPGGPAPGERAALAR